MIEDNPISNGGGNVEPRRELEDIIDDNTELVPFNPNVDTGFGTKRVVIKDQEIQVHETHALHEVLAVHMEPNVTNVTVQAELERLSSVHGLKFRTGELSSILQELEAQYPRLYQKLAAAVNRFYEALDARNIVAQQHGRDSSQYQAVLAKYRPSSEELAYREYYFSKGIDAAAILISELGLEITPAQLCE